MVKLVDEFWNICWPGAHGSEIGLEPYDCPEPWECHCLEAERAGGMRRRCGHPFAEARAEVIAHYRNRAAYLDGLSDAEFLEWMGYYESDEQEAA